MSYEITGLIIAHNEAHELPDCLKNWTEVCKELVVVDDQSIDATPEIARSFGAKVIETLMDEETGFAGLRNTGLEAIQTSHVLVFDADERPTRTLVQSIHETIAEGRDNTAYIVDRRNAAFGGWLDHGRFSPDWQTRLFSSDIRYSGLVHEAPQLPEGTEVLQLNGKIIHFTYASLKEYITKMRHYAEKQAVQSEPPSIKAVAFTPLYSLIKRRGYKDGWRGFAMALGDGWYEYMVRNHSQKLV